MATSTLNRLFEAGETKGMKKGLTNVLLLDKAFDFPSKAAPFIHVAGTNGKGSVSLKIARSLPGKVGLYTSPHLQNFRERIEINGQWIEEESSEKWLEEIFKQSDYLSIKPTFFEILTLLALLYFREQKVDYAVFEVGMGGRWDATNIITPLLSVIVSIALDHTKYLGSCLEEIAFEKAGIIKSGIPVVLGPQAAQFPIFEQMASFFHSPVIKVDCKANNYEQENREIALRALSNLKNINFSREGILATPRCRFEAWRVGDVKVILDVGHNPKALCSIFSRLEENELSGVLFALSSDKEIESCIEILAKQQAYIIFTQAPSRRAASAELLAKCYEKKCKKPFAVVPDIKEAFLTALKKSRGKTLLICGSFFIMGPVIEIIEEAKGLLIDSAN